jgi:hypothetical protein
MSESEIRAILRQVCERLARQVVVPARKAALPMAIGAGLMAGQGCIFDPMATPEYMAPDVEVPEATPVYSAPDDAFTPPPDTLYMGPDIWDDGAVPPYMAPDTGPQPEYMAPEDAGIGTDTHDPDPGFVPLYSVADAVDPDPGVEPPYMAPDTGPQPEYMAPEDVVEPKDVAEVDNGMGMLYMAP